MMAYPTPIVPHTLGLFGGVTAILRGVVRVIIQAVALEQRVPVCVCVCVCACVVAVCVCVCVRARACMTVCA